MLVHVVVSCHSLIRTIVESFGVCVMVRLLGGRGHSPKLWLCNGTGRHTSNGTEKKEVLPS